MILPHYDGRSKPAGLGKGSNPRPPECSVLARAIGRGLTQPEVSLRTVRSAHAWRGGLVDPLLPPPTLALAQYGIFPVEVLPGPPGRKNPEAASNPCRADRGRVDACSHWRERLVW